MRNSKKRGLPITEVTLGRIDAKTAKDSGGMLSKGGEITVPAATLDKMSRANPQGYLRDLQMAHKGLTVGKRWVGASDRSGVAITSVWAEDGELYVSKTVGRLTESGGIAVTALAWSSVMYVGNQMTKAKKGRKKVK